jgi:uncharacterized protein YicC (UPF0701 family)
MTEKELFEQKKQSQLDAWKAELDKLKAKAEGAGADARMKLNEEISRLEDRVQEGQSKLAEIRNASGDAWKSIADSLDLAWAALKQGFSDAAKKFDQ